MTAPLIGRSGAQTRNPALSQVASEFFGYEEFTLTRQGGDKERLSVLVEAAA